MSDNSSQKAKVGRQLMIIAVTWMIGTMGILIWQGVSSRFEESVLITLIVATSVTILGVYAIYKKWHFPNNK